MAYLDIGVDQAILLFFLLLAVYFSTLLAGRLIFSPLVKFPGPRLAATSFLYEFYYDFICRGRYEFKIEDLHDKYGPIIRINPDELHIRDPEFHSQIYVNSGVRKSSRPASHRNATPSRESTATTLDHDHHRQRRKALEPYFSKNMVTKLEPEIQSIVKRLHERLWQHKGSPTPINLFEVYGAVASDVVTAYCFGSSWGSLEKDNYDADTSHVHMFFTKLMPIFRLFPSLLTLSLAIPEWMIKDPGVVQMQRYRHRVEKQVADVRRATSLKKAGGAGKGITGHTTIFHELLERSTLPPSELADHRLTDEAITLVGAGLVTTAQTLAFVSFYLLNQPEALAKLQNALEPLMVSYPAKTPTWTQLEAVPYLNAVVLEGLRMHGVARRIARIFPDEDLKYKEWTIPAGTAVGMSASALHDYERVFPEPHSFIPDRWLEGDVDLKRKYWVPFGRGSRACIGISLAYVELYHVITAVFRPNGLKMKLFETDESDVKYEHDFLFPSPREDSKGIRVLIS